MALAPRSFKGSISVPDSGQQHQFGVCPDSAVLPSGSAPVFSSFSHLHPVLSNGERAGEII